MGARSFNPQERLEGSVAGRAVLSAFIAVTLLTVLAFQLPASHLRSQAMQVAAPYGNATGLDQNWSVFAPDPRRMSIALEARVAYEDGSRSVWRMPYSNDFVGVYWDYRWQKVIEHLRLDVNSRLWPAFAAWVAQEHRDRGQVTRVQLVRRWQELLPPGRPDGRLASPWREHEFFKLDVVSVPEA